MSSKVDGELSRMAGQLNLSNGNEEDNVNCALLQLPERVHRGLFEYLSPWCLMDLRLASKATKKLVDDYALEKLPLQVLNHGQMEKEAFKHSATLWKSVVIRSDAQNNDVNWIQNPLYSELLIKLSSSLSSLTLSEHRLPYLGLRSILCTCVSLKRLEIGTLWCGDWKTGEEEDVNCAEANKLVTSLGRLETLSIGFLAWNKEEDLEAFKYILTQTSSIQFLKVPHVLMANFLQSDDEDDEVTEQRYLNLITTALVDPLLKFITACGKRMTTKAEWTLQPTAVLDVENMHHSELFPKIVEACFNAGIRLLNVSEAFENPIPEEELKYLQTIQSLSGCTQYLNFRQLSNLKSITLDSETSADSDVNENSISAPLASLKSISYCLPDDISPNLLMFLKQHRPNVETLCVEFQIEEPLLSQLFPPLVLTQGFSHLQHLTLINWDGKDEDLILILQSLTSLLSLRLHGCNKITDKGFLGENSSEPSALLNLKGLKDLWIDCHITNTILKDAIRHLRLEALYYSSELVTLPGFLSLTQGPLVETLISFPVIPPESCTDEVLQRFISYFKNLKRKPLPPSFQC